MKHLFTKHPHSMGETYFQHFICAATFGSQMLFGGVACLIHTVFPCVLQETASNLLFRMVHNMVKRMPVVDNRAAMLAQAITKKMSGQKDI